MITVNTCPNFDYDYDYITVNFCDYGYDYDYRENVQSFVIDYD